MPSAPAAPQEPSASAAAYAKPKPFVPAPAAATTSPAAAPAPTAPGAPATPAAPSAQAPVGGGSQFTFQVGEFAHDQSANTLMATLKKRGYTVRTDQAKRNNKTFYKVFASKEGSRAALEGELLTLGVSEPRLVSEQPAASAPPAGQTAAPAVSAPTPAAAPAPAPAPAAKSRPTPTIAPPVVEPAPPLPDGYVPPPPKNKS